MPHYVIKHALTSINLKVMSPVNFLRTGLLETLNKHVNSLRDKSISNHKNHQPNTKHTTFRIQLS